SETIFAATPWARMMLAVQDRGRETADRRQHVRPATSGSTPHVLFVEPLLLCGAHVAASIDAGANTAGNGLNACDSEPTSPGHAGRTKKPSSPSRHGAA